MVTTIKRLPAVKDATGYSRSTIYIRVRSGLFPKPVRLGENSVGWPADEIAAVNAARIAGKSDDAIRDLVIQLHAARVHAA